MCVCLWILVQTFVPKLACSFGSTIRRGLLQWLVGKKISSSFNGQIQEGTNSLIILGVLTLWCHRYQYLFDGASLSIARAQLFASDELHLWGWLGHSLGFLPHSLFASWLWFDRGQVLFVERRSSLGSLWCMCFARFEVFLGLRARSFFLMQCRRGRLSPAGWVLFLIRDSYVCSRKKLCYAIIACKW